MENITNKTPVNILDAIRNGTAFEAIQPFQEPSWLMRDFAYQAQIVQIQGQSGATWIGCELAKSIAEGSRFVSRYECTAPCGVVYIQGGMTDSHIRERISRLSTLENRASINIISPEKTFNDEPPNLCDETFQDEFSAALSTNTYGAAIFDTVGCFMPEKPEPSQIIRLINCLKKAGLTIINVKSKEKNGLDIPWNQADLILKINRMNDFDDLTLQCSFHKARSLKPDQQKTFFVKLTETDGGKLSFTGCVLDEFLKARTVQLLLNGWKQAKIANEIGKNQSTVSRWIKESIIPESLLVKDNRRYIPTEAGRRLLEKHDLGLEI